MLDQLEIMQTLLEFGLSLAKRWYPRDSYVTAVIADNPGRLVLANNLLVVVMRPSVPNN